MPYDQITNRFPDARSWADRSAGAYAGKPDLGGWLMKTTDRLPEGDVWERAKLEKNWMCFRVEHPGANGKASKVPCNARGGYDVATENAAFMTFEQAMEAQQALASRILEINEKLIGRGNQDKQAAAFCVGYLARPGSALVTLDLDKVIGPDGVLAYWVPLLGETYTEVSTSGIGLHILTERQPGDDRVQEKNSAGIYAGTQRGIALTFKHVEGTPTQINGATVARQAVFEQMGKVRETNHRAPNDRTTGCKIDTGVVSDHRQMPEILDGLPNPANGRDEWVRMAHACKAAAVEADTETALLIEQAFFAWSQRGEAHGASGKGDSPQRLWNSIKAVESITAGTFYYIAKDLGWTQPEGTGAKKGEYTTKPIRSFNELIEAAKALKPGQIDELEAILLDCAELTPARQDAVLQAIKIATGVSLTTLRSQMKADEKTTLPPIPDHLDLARMTLAEIGRANILSTEAFVWKWQERGVWAQQEDRGVKQAVQNRLDTEPLVDVTANLVNSVTDVLKSEVYKPYHQFNRGNPETVNALNGELELSDGSWQLKPHNRDNYRTTQIPVEYDPYSDAPLFSAFLGQVFRDDPDRNEKTIAVLELMGYTLMSHARHERFVMLIGPGANGKSVLLSVLEKLLGSENVAGVQPANFDNRFQRAHLHEKLANIVTELKQGEVIADAELKAITSGEPATVEHKHKDPFVMRPFSTCWFGTNHMPHTRDFSDALFRRATILQFNRTFSDEEQDPLLKEKLLTELPGILNFALRAYGRALTDGFTHPPSSEAAKQEWRLEADQVALFVDEVCERVEAAKVPVGEVFSYYQTWASQNGINKSMSKKGFRDRLTRLGFGSYRYLSTRYVTGLRLVSGASL